MSFQYKTKFMSSPDGKAKVYYTAHPDDFATYYDMITEEVLERQSCAVWSDPQFDPLDEEKIFNLSAMQLFVVPVTKKLLTTPNRAMDEEIPFAIKNFISVLPIMLEAGLENLFNEKFGSLQYLDKVTVDPTTISYAEKLSNYLGSVLISDELSDKVRQAFDAYIFLSYRKKDRKYAQELMRLIHKYDFCRDIAIWYDEFLVPGENFNHFIDQALKKSDLFAMVMTPNMTDETNYVMTTEYPKALDEQKQILPIELVPVDKDTMRERYDRIPECVNAYDENGLSAALLEKFKNLAMRGNDDPEHNFFIGLAYLAGIDVEKDYERARKLITQAAEAELPEAILKLVSMYRTGNGVEKNYDTAISWQERFVAIKEAAYKEAEEKDEDHERAETLACNLTLNDALLDLSVYCMETGRTEDARKAILRAMSISFTMQSDWLDALHNFARSFYMLAKVFMMERNFVQAEQQFEKALQYFVEEAEDFVSDGEALPPQVNAAIKSAAASVGMIKTLTGNTKDAEIYYDMSIRGFDAVGYENEGEEDDAAEEDPAHLMMLALRHMLMGKQEDDAAKDDMEEDIDEENDTESVDEESLAEEFQKFDQDELYRIQPELDPDDQEALTTAKRLYGMSVLFHRKKDYENAKKVISQSLDILEYLALRTKKSDFSLLLMNGYLLSGMILKDNQDLEEAKICYENAEAMIESGLIDPDLPNSISVICSCYEKIGQFYEAIREPENARPYYEKEYAYLQKLLAGKNTLMIDQWVTYLVCASRLGKLSEAQGNFDSSKEYYLEYNHAAKQALALRQTTFDHRNLANSYFALARLYEKMNAATADIIEHYEEAATAIQNALKLETDKGDQFLFSLTLDRLGSFAMEAENYELAWKYYDTEADTVLEAVKGSEDPRDMALYAEALWNAAYAKYKLGSEDAQQLLGEAHDAYVYFHELCPSFPFFAERLKEIEAEFDFI